MSANSESGNAHYLKIRLQISSCWVLDGCFREDQTHTVPYPLTKECAHAEVALQQPTSNAGKNPWHQGDSFRTKA
eukprot:6487114-Amphidinium_carterae.1